MLDIGWSELLIIAIVMIVVVGPKDLPKMLRAFGKATARMRSTANEFRNQFNEALKEAELEDVKNIVDEARKLNPRSKLTEVFDPIRSAGEDIRAGLQSTTSMSPAEPAKPAEVTTPVAKDGATVPFEVKVETPNPEAKAEKLNPEKPATKPRAPRKKAVAATSVEAPAEAKPVKAKSAAKPTKAAAKAVAAKAAPAKKTTKKTTDKTGTKA